MEYENRALLYIGERIKERFSLPQSPEEIWDSIEACRKPHMESRHVRYVPVKDLVSMCLGRFLEKNGISMDGRDDEWIREMYVLSHEKNSRLAPKALEGIEEMRDIAWHLGVISDADDDYLHAVLSALGILELFDSITSSEEVGVGKPNARIFKKAMEKSGNADVFVHIGDSERRDVGGAKSAGMRAILISKEKKDGKADFVAGNLYEAALWIKRNLIREPEMR